MGSGGLSNDMEEPAAAHRIDCIKCMHVQASFLLELLASNQISVITIKDEPVPGEFGIGIGTKGTAHAFSFNADARTTWHRRILQVDWR